MGVHLGALAPLLWLFLAVPRGHLGGDPVQGVIHYLGIGALRLLLLTLLVSPLARLLKYPSLIRLRRPLGLWCFAWATLHFAAWMILDLALEWRLIGAEIVERSYLLVGFAAWLLLGLLAITSLPTVVRRMGRRWKPLHRLVYLALPLACLHFWWSQKSGWLDPAIYTLLALALLAARWRGRRLAAKRRLRAADEDAHVRDS